MAWIHFGWTIRIYILFGHTPTIWTSESGHKKRTIQILKLKFKCQAFLRTVDI